MDPLSFVAKWKGTHLSERSACQQHSLDLCGPSDLPDSAAQEFLRCAGNPHQRPNPDVIRPAFAVDWWTMKDPR
jgi:hypothetical protein